MPTPYAYFQGGIVPLADAKIGIMTHAFNYGTACFEGVRGNWNAEEEQLYLFRIEDHIRRLRASTGIIRINFPYTDAEACRLLLEVVERSGFTEDIYCRPLAYKSAEKVGVRLDGIEDDFLIFVTPFGNYLDVDKGIRCQVSTWRRIDDNAAPSRAKITGIYINSALAKSEAEANGFDEAIMLTQDGHVSEGSGENIFLVQNGKLITPPVSENLLVGITRDTVITLAREELGIETIERQVDRTELYISSEVFMTGTAAHVTPVLEIDRRLVGGHGQIGEITAQLSKLYFDTIRGKIAKYKDWCTPAYKLVKA